MKSYWLDITPAMATDLQKSDAPKRSLSPRHAQALARDMAAGQWKATPQGIVLDHLGRLIDGWHRMRAIVLAKTTVRMWVTATEDEAETKEIEAILDLGRPRSFSDRLAFEGMRNTKQLAAIARRAYHWQAECPWAYRVIPTSEELDQIVRKEQDLVAAARFAVSWTHYALIPGSVAGFCWWVLRQADAEEAEWFMSALGSGAELDEGSPVLALRERLMEQRIQQTTRARLTPELRVWLVFYAWNLFRARRQVKQLKLPVNPITNENFPRPQ